MLRPSTIPRRETVTGRNPFGQAATAEGNLRKSRLHRATVGESQNPHAPVSRNQRSAAETGAVVRNTPRLSAQLGQHDKPQASPQPSVSPQRSNLSDQKSDPDPPPRRSWRRHSIEENLTKRIGHVSQQAAHATDRLTPNKKPANEHEKDGGSIDKHVSKSNDALQDNALRRHLVQDPIHSKNQLEERGVLLEGAKREISDLHEQLRQHRNEIEMLHRAQRIGHGQVIQDQVRAATMGLQEEVFDKDQQIEILRSQIREQQNEIQAQRQLVLEAEGVRKKLVRKQEELEELRESAHKSQLEVDKLHAQAREAQSELTRLQKQQAAGGQEGPGLLMSHSPQPGLGGAAGSGELQTLELVNAQAGVLERMNEIDQLKARLEAQAVELQEQQEQIEEQEARVVAAEWNERALRTEVSEGEIEIKQIKTKSLASLGEAAATVRADWQGWELMVKEQSQEIEELQRCIEAQQKSLQEQQDSIEEQAEKVAQAEIVRARNLDRVIKLWRSAKPNVSLGKVFTRWRELLVDPDWWGRMQISLQRTLQDMVLIWSNREKQTMLHGIILLWWTESLRSCRDALQLSSTNAEDEVAQLRREVAALQWEIAKHPASLVSGNSRESQMQMDFEEKVMELSALEGRLLSMQEEIEEQQEEIEALREGAAMTQASLTEAREHLMEQRMTFDKVEARKELDELKNGIGQALGGWFGAADVVDDTVDNRGKTEDRFQEQHQAIDALQAELEAKRGALERQVQERNSRLHALPSLRVQIQRHRDEVMLQAQVAIGQLKLSSEEVSAETNALETKLRRTSMKLGAEQSRFVQLQEQLVEQEEEFDAERTILLRKIAQAKSNPEDSMLLHRVSGMSPLNAISIVHEATEEAQLLKGEEQKVRQELSQARQDLEECQADVEEERERHEADLVTLEEGNEWLQTYTTALSSEMKRRLRKMERKANRFRSDLERNNPTQELTNTVFVWQAEHRELREEIQAERELNERHSAQRPFSSDGPTPQLQEGVSNSDESEWKQPELECLHEHATRTWPDAPEDASFRVRGEALVSGLLREASEEAQELRSQVVDLRERLDEEVSMAIALEEQLFDYEAEADVEFEARVSAKEELNERRMTWGALEGEFKSQAEFGRKALEDQQIETERFRLQLREQHERTHVEIKQLSDEHVAAMGEVAHLRAMSQEKLEQQEIEAQCLHEELRNQHNELSAQFGDQEANAEIVLFRARDEAQRLSEELQQQSEVFSEQLQDRDEQAWTQMVQMSDEHGDALDEIGQLHAKHRGRQEEQEDETNRLCDELRKQQEECMATMRTRANKVSFALIGGKTKLMLVVIFNAWLHWVETSWLEMDFSAQIRNQHEESQAEISQLNGKHCEALGEVTALLNEEHREDKEKQDREVHHLHDEHRKEHEELSVQLQCRDAQSSTEIAQLNNKHNGALREIIQLRAKHQESQEEYENAVVAAAASSKLEFDTQLHNRNEKSRTEISQLSHDHREALGEIARLGAAHQEQQEEQELEVRCLRGQLQSRHEELSAQLRDKEKEARATVAKLSSMHGESLGFALREHAEAGDEITQLTDEYGEALGEVEELSAELFEQRAQAAAEILKLSGKHNEALCEIAQLSASARDQDHDMQLRLQTQHKELTAEIHACNAELVAEIVQASDERDAALGAVAEMNAEYLQQLEFQTPLYDCEAETWAEIAQLRNENREALGTASELSDQIRDQEAERCVEDHEILRLRDLLHDQHEEHVAAVRAQANSAAFALVESHSKATLSFLIRAWIQYLELSKAENELSKSVCEFREQLAASRVETAEVRAQHGEALEEIVNLHCKHEVHHRMQKSEREGLLAQLREEREESQRETDHLCAELQDQHKDLSMELRDRDEEAWAEIAQIKKQHDEAMAHVTKLNEKISDHEEETLAVIKSHDDLHGKSLGEVVHLNAKLREQEDTHECHIERLHTELLGQREEDLCEAGRLQIQLRVLDESKQQDIEQLQTRLQQQFDENQLKIEHLRAGIYNEQEDKQREMDKLQRRHDCRNEENLRETELLQTQAWEVHEGSQREVHQLRSQLEEIQREYDHLHTKCLDHEVERQHELEELHSMHRHRCDGKQREIEWLQTQLHELHEGRRCEIENFRVQQEKRQRESEYSQTQLLNFQAEKQRQIEELRGQLDKQQQENEMLRPQLRDPQEVEQLQAQIRKESETRRHKILVLQLQLRDLYEEHKDELETVNRDRRLERSAALRRLERLARKLECFGTEFMLRRCVGVWHVLAVREAAEARDRSAQRFQREACQVARHSLHLYAEQLVALHDRSCSSGLLQSCICAWRANTYAAMRVASAELQLQRREQFALGRLGDALASAAARSDWRRSHTALRCGFGAWRMCAQTEVSLRRMEKSLKERADEEASRLAEQWRMAYHGSVLGDLGATGADDEATVWMDSMQRLVADLQRDNALLHGKLLRPWQPGSRSPSPPRPACGQELLLRQPCGVVDVSACLPRGLRPRSSTTPRRERIGLGGLVLPGGKLGTVAPALPIGYHSPLPAPPPMPRPLASS